MMKSEFGKMTRDIRFASRMLWKNPGFTALAVLTLGLGIGAVSVFFGLFDALVIRPFAYPDADRIACIWSNYSSNLTQPLSMPDYEDIRDQSRSFSDIGVFWVGDLNLELDTPVRTRAAHCTFGVLRTFGIEPLLGRLLKEDDQKTGAEPVAVISYSLWQQVFGGNSRVIGRSIRLDGKATTVVGIMPSEIDFMAAWEPGVDVDLWVPLARNNTFSDDMWESRGFHWLRGIGRLREDVPVESADAEIKTIGGRLTTQYPDTNLNKPFIIQSLRQQITEKSESFMHLSLGAGALLLLVACANAASMLLARGTLRQEEFGIRLSLGGSRRDILRLLLCESLLLSFLGCIIGIILAESGLVMMQHVLPSTLITANQREALQLNSLLLTFSVGLSILTGLFSGLAPAVSATRTPVAEALKLEGRSQTGSLLRHRLLRFLAAGQIAVSVVLGNGALQFSISYLNVLKDNSELDTDQVVTADFALRGDRYANPEALKVFLNELSERVHTLPGVAGVGITTKLPLVGGRNFSFLIDDEAYDPAVGRPLAEKSTVTSEYFSAMGISLIRGRLPGTEHAAADAVEVVVNQTMANSCWPGKDPIGGIIRENGQVSRFQATVVGVVADVRQFGPEYPAIPEIYFPFRGEPSPMTLVVRTKGDAHVLIPSIQRLVTAMDRDLPLADIRTMKEVVSKSTSSRRFLTQLVGLFMALTVILAMAGIYGTLSYTMSQRRREIGVRIALGAIRRDIMKFVFRQAAFLIIGGLAVGLILTVSLSFVLRSALYGVSPMDPLLLLSGLAAIGAAAAGACFFPARRATRLDPMEALRCD